MQKYMSKDGWTHLLDRYEKRENPWKTKGRFEKKKRMMFKHINYTILKKCQRT